MQWCQCHFFDIAIADGPCQAFSTQSRNRAPPEIHPLHDTLMGGPHNPPGGSVIGFATRNQAKVFCTEQVFGFNMLRKAGAYCRHTPLREFVERMQAIKTPLGRQLYPAVTVLRTCCSFWIDAKRPRPMPKISKAHRALYFFCFPSSAPVRDTAQKGPRTALKNANTSGRSCGPDLRPSRRVVVQEKARASVQKLPETKQARPSSPVRSRQGGASHSLRRSGASHQPSTVGQRFAPPWSS